MKVLLYVCFILFVTDGATGQSPDPICANIVDFDECNPGNGKCDEKISKCICFEDQPFCQCNSKKGEFYIDENCSQRWTVTTFALVASLPGLTLAVLVGVIVYVLMLSSEKSHTGEEMKRHKTASKEQDLFPGTTFASDMNGRPPPNQRPLQQGHIQMAANRPYSPSSSVYQPAVKTDGRPRETNRYVGSTTCEGCSHVEGNVLRTLRNVP
ncbi:hypothetical protein DPX16_22972 [Anabarilius grahami]|uniref:Uncharacterized protein n=1 Tax=Anabarilius grahami TaxID=495550 RepID=A0A3N0XH93_ANAGA|nr:hypothetical protein DPX16_22972 [Anabarilius grahami]